MFKAEVKSEENEDICILINVDNHKYNYICDCGEAKSLKVKECQNTNAIFLSHTHIDHFVNFDTVLRHQIGANRKIVICGPKGIIEQVQNRIKSYTWNLIKKSAISYEVRELSNGLVRSVVLNPPFWKQENETYFNKSIIFEEKDFHVEYEVLDHKIDSIAYLFKAKDKIKIKLEKGFKSGKWVSDLKTAFIKNNKEQVILVDKQEFLAKNLFYMIKVEKGKKLGIIMDHAANKENHQKIKAKFFRSDEVYIECFYKDEDKDLANKNYHSHASMSGQIMRESEVKNAIPVHFSRKYRAKEREEIVEQFEKAKNNNTSIY